MKTEQVVVEQVMVQGNLAVGLASLAADCDAYFGYPITPQNEITEWFSREFPSRGKTFVQTASENSSIMMVFGAGAAGFRCMTSTAGPGWALMQEGISHMVNAEVPGLIVVVQRGGPGQGTIRHAQMDYLSATRGGGQGGYKNIVLAPASVQETYDFVQLGFHLADKYRNPVILLSDGILGQLMEALEVRKLEFEPLPQKTWAVSGRGLHEDGQVRRVISVAGNVACPPYPPYNNYMDLIKALNAKFQEIAGTEVRYETYLADDAELLLVAYGYVARVCKEAIIRARSKGLKVGMFRPMTLWPFPYQALKRYALQNRRLLVVEDSLGQLVDDVELAIKGGSKVSFLGMLARNLPIDTGLILPGAVLAKIEEVYQLGDEDE